MYLTQIYLTNIQHETLTRLKTGKPVQSHKAKQQNDASLFSTSETLELNLPWLGI